MGASDTTVPAEFRDPEYKLRRFRNWMLVGLLYSFFYMSRYNFSAVAPSLQLVFGWTKGDLGIFETLLPLVYGLSVVFNGPLADRIGGRKAFLFGAAGVVVMNLVFGAFCFLVDAPAVFGGADGKTLVAPAQLAWGLGPRALAWIMAACWALNGYFQSFGALSIVKINAQWFHLRERGTFAAIFGVLIRAGLILAFSGAPLILKYMDWQWAFWIPAGLVFVLFLGNWLFVVETPEDAGFPARDTGDEVAADGGGRAKVIDILRKVFASRVMWTIALGSMMIGMVRRSVLDAWWPVYFRDVHHLGMTSTAAQVATWGLATSGIIGGFTLGIMSDKIFTGRRAPVVVYGFIGMALCLGLFLLADYLALGPYGAAGSLILLSFFVNGAHGMIGGAASMDFGGRKAAATAAGLFDGMQYLAAAVTGTAVGYISEEYGWQAWKLWAIPFALIGAVVMSFLWNETPRGKAGAH
jgi:OPA family glycerol-3-phosphate transporter-like MFS transporter